MVKLNGKLAIKIKARYLMRFKSRGKISWLFDCEGRQVWFPAKCVKKLPSEDEILVEKWLFDEKVKGGEL
jgi:hypothetical protein